jgi:hypothetical protein
MPESFVGEADTASVQISFFSSSSSSSSSNKYLQEENQTRVGEREREVSNMCAPSSQKAQPASLRARDGEREKERGRWGE